MHSQCVWERKRWNTSCFWQIKTLLSVLINSCPRYSWYNNYTIFTDTTLVQNAVRLFESMTWYFGIIKVVWYRTTFMEIRIIFKSLQLWESISKPCSNERWKKVNVIISSCSLELGKSQNLSDPFLIACLLFHCVIQLL